MSRGTPTRPAGSDIFVASNIDSSTPTDTNAPTASLVAGGQSFSGGVMHDRDSDRSGDSGLLVSSSGDSGTTFLPRVAATDTSSDDLDPACCDPSVAADSFGNLFLTYLADLPNGAYAVPLYVSTDNGVTWSEIKRWRGNPDQPTVTAGNGIVAVTFTSGESAVMSSARVTGAGPSGVGRFSALQRVPGPGGSFGDIAIGPGGQIAVAYITELTSERSDIYVSVDRDGPGPLSFGKAVRLARVNVGAFTKVAAQSDRAIDTEISLAWDRSGGPATGRLYATYTDRTSPDGSGDGTKIVTRFSDDGGSSFGDEVRLDDGPDAASKILPRSVLDQTNGVLIVGWHDTRFDTGSGSDSTDAVANNDVAYVATVAVPTAGSLDVSPNRRVSPGVTNAAHAAGNVELGDYTGLDAHASLAVAAFADNSNTTGDNPDGTHHEQDIYVARMQVSGIDNTGAPGSLRPDDLSSLVRGLPSAVRRGRSLAVTVRLKDPAGFPLNELGTITLVDDQGRALNVTITRRSVSADLRTASLSLRVTRPDGAPFTSADNGAYSLVLDNLTDALGQLTPTRLLGTLRVNVASPRASVFSNVTVSAQPPSNQSQLKKSPRITPWHEPTPAFNI